MLRPSKVTLVLRVQGLRLAEYLRGRDPVFGTVYYLMLVVLALVLLLVARDDHVKATISTEDK